MVAQTQIISAIDPPPCFDYDDYHDHDPGFSYPYPSPPEGPPPHWRVGRLASSSAKAFHK